MSPPYLLHQLLEQAASDSPSNQAVVDLVGPRRAFDYQTLYGMASSCAAVLQDLGINRRDRVAIYLRKSVEEAAAIFSSTLAGGVLVDVNPLLLGHQVAHILCDCGVRYLITSSQEWLRIGDEVSKVASIQCVLFVDEWEGNCDRGIPIRDKVLNRADKPRACSAIGEDLAAILYTSGSTGKPRGVMLSHRNLLAGSRIVSAYLELGPAERILSILPFSFDYGLNQLLTSVEQRATIVLFQYRFATEIVAALRDENITGLAGLPLVWAGLVHHTSGLSKNPPPCLRYITNSGGAVPTSTVRKLRELLPATRIFLMYGLTEAFRSTYLPPEEVDGRPNSIGKAIPETEILVVNSEGQLCKPGEVGTLIHRGPTVSLGYWGNAELTRQVLRRHPFLPDDQGGDLVCYSGDLVRCDEDGFLYFCGRADGQIKSQGYRVSPAEVEEVLMETGQIAHAAVIGLPAGEAGEKVHALVVPIEASHVNSDSLLSHCAKRLPPFMVPKSLEVIDALPKTPNGKTDYKLLRATRLGPLP